MAEKPPDIRMTLPSDGIPPDAPPTPLSPADWELFTAALDNPPAPNEALAKALSRRKKRIRTKHETR
jgi:hypothetical protein